MRCTAVTVVLAEGVYLVGVWVGRGERRATSKGRFRSDYSRITELAPWALDGDDHETLDRSSD